MCGIFGFTATGRSAAACEAELAAMSQTLLHRGPDATGYCRDNFLAMGMNRLAIIDLDKRANQPLYSADGRYAIVYNGEIYNYREVREALESTYTFETASDTEVLLYTFIDGGIDGLNRLNGMFAFCIYDLQECCFYLGRDRLGVKPLYYAHTGDRVVFASEMKAILQHVPMAASDIDPRSEAYYLIYEAVPEPATLFKGVRMVEAGTVLRVDAELGETTERYWRLPPLAPDEGMREEDAVATVREILEDAVRIRLRSDVDVGIFLSGGIDSTLVAAIAARLHPGLRSFSIGYDDTRHDESVYAEATAHFLGLEHHTLKIDPRNGDEGLLDSVADALVANVTFIPYLRLSEYAARYVKVALNGDGGDEFFCGYSTLGRVAAILRIRGQVPSWLWKGLLRLLGPLYRRLKLPKSWVVDILDFDSPEELLALFQAKSDKETFRKTLDGYGFPDAYRLPCNPCTFQELNYLQAATFLPNTVLKTADMATMAFSLEGRSPLLDYRLIEFAATIPESLHTKGGESKYILKKVLENYMPRELFDRPKKGFSVPISDLRAFRTALLARFKARYLERQP